MFADLLKKHKQEAAEAEQAGKEPIDFNSLFKSHNITGLNIHYWKRSLTNSFYWYGNLKYKMGDMAGEKQFEAESLNGLLEQIEEFAEQTG